MILLTFLALFKCISSICLYFFFLDTTIYIPSFDGTSYLELQPLSSLLQPSGASNNLPATVKDTTVILYLTVKTRATQGTILYSEYGLFLLQTFKSTGKQV